MGFAAGTTVLLLGAFLTAAVIFLLYWVRPEPQPVVVPSNLIWKKVLDERRRREDFWRWLISLATALLVGLAVVLALARPLPEGPERRSPRTVVVLDNSPSLLAQVPEGGTRWDRARAQARRILSSGNETSEFLVLDTAGQRGGRSFSGRREALEALAGMAPVYGAEHGFPDLEDLLATEGRVVPAAEVILIGDGVRVGAAPAGVERVSVFEPVANAGITAFDVRPLPTDPGRFEAFIEVVRHGVSAGEGESGVVVLQLDGAGGATLRRTLRVLPGEPLGETVPLTGFVAGPVRAVIAAAGEDGLAADDEAHSYIPARNRLRVFFVGGDDPYWQAALQLDPRVSLIRPAAEAGADATPSEPFSDFDPAEEDLVVIEGAAPPPILAAPVLFAGPGTAEWLPPRLAGSGAEGDGSGSEAAPSGPIASGEDRGGSAVTLPIRPEQTGHPLLRDLDFGDALARPASPFDAGAFEGGAAGPWVLLMGDSRLGLLAARELPVRGLAFAFPLSTSNLPLQPDFPVFLSRALSWLTDVDVRRSDLGQVRLAMPTASVFDAEGRPVPSRRLGSEISFEATEPSLYYAAGSGREVVVAASLLDREVSDLNRSAWSSEPPAALAAAGSPGRVLWPLLALFALVLLVAEWVAFHRHATV